MSGNGVDLAAIYQAIVGLGTDLRRVREQMATKDDLARMATKDDLARLRQTVVEYHSAVVGHGILISELDDRLRRVEQHLGLSPAA